MPYKDPAAKLAWQRAHPEKHRAYQAAYQAAHPEKYRASQAAYRAAHREERRAYDVAYRERGGRDKQSIHRTAKTIQKYRDRLNALRKGEQWLTEELGLQRPIQTQATSAEHS